MAVSYNTVTVASTATVIKAANNARRGITIYNNGNTVLYWGPDASITTANAIPILPQSSYETSGPQAWKGVIYGIVGSATTDVRYFEWEQ